MTSSDYWDSSESDSDVVEVNTSTTSKIIKKRKIQWQVNKRAKKKAYDQKFKEDWLQLPEFRGWLAAIPSNKFRCKCDACEIVLKCGKSELMKHNASTKHKENVKKRKGIQKISEIFSGTTIHSKNVAKAEILLTNYFAHHNVAIQTVEHLVPVLKQCFPKEKICQDMALGRTKTTSIIKNVIAKKTSNDLSDILKKQHFSILVDESTDIAVNKLFAVVVKYFDTSNGTPKITDMLLELITIDAKDASAEKLYERFKECLKLRNIPIINVIGFASDNANVLVGKNNSFSTRLLADSDALILLPCICHTSALIANHACAKLPRTPEEFLRSISSYFSVSAKRTAELVEMQEFFMVEKKKMIKLAPTRWLSMQHAVQRVLDNWTILFHYFQVAHLEDKSKLVCFIYEEMSNNCTKAVLLFLSYILSYFNTFNALFQSKKLLIPELSTECRKLFKTLITHYIKDEFVNDLSVEVQNPRLFKDLKNVNLGIKCNSFMSENLPENVASSIRKSCLDFLITAAVEAQKRLPLKDKFFDALKFLKPHIALAIQKPSELTSLVNIYKEFTNIKDLEIDSIDLEWLDIAIYFEEDKTLKQTFLQESTENFWWQLGKIKNFRDIRQFKNVAFLAQLCMSLPHSNAETERIFSVVTDVKCKKRNKLSSNSLDAIAKIRFSSPSCCQDFSVEDEHLTLMLSKNLYL